MRAASLRPSINRRPSGCRGVGTASRPQVAWIAEGVGRVDLREGARSLGSNRRRVEAWRTDHQGSQFVPLLVVLVERSRVRCWIRFFAELLVELLGVEERLVHL